jgi:hypothetical protein
MPNPLLRGSAKRHETSHWCSKTRRSPDARRDGKYSAMLAAAISQADFEVMQSLARALRVHVDVLPDGPEIVGAIRAEVGPAAHPPDPPPRDGKLMAVVLELLRTPGLSPEQTVDLQESFFAEE